MITQALGFVNTFQISSNTVHFKNSNFYNYPFSDGNVTETFKTTS